MRVTDGASYYIGSLWVFLIAAAAIGLTGAIWAFSDEWRSWLDTVVGVLTFLLMFPLQASLNRTSKAQQAKDDEIINALPEARNELIRADECDDDEIDRIRIDPECDNKK